jgi:hypothetical protein
MRKYKRSTGQNSTGHSAADYLNKKFFENLENKTGRTRLMKETKTLEKYDGASTL